MVYRGKPSPGCASCRRRRIKCDQQKPSCSQCIRADQQCTGYRDPNALRLHDQSHEVANKSVQQAPCALKPESLALPCLSAPVTDHAVAFMFRHYVGNVQANSTTTSQLRFLHALLVESTPALMASIHAVGLAALANIHQSSRLMIAARKEYGRALRATSAALRDACMEDSTLAAVALLSMYEIFNCEDSSLIGRWSKHIQGAAKLIELRGSKQLDNPMGLEMFTAFRIQIALSNIYRRTYIPTWLLQLSREAQAHHSPAEQALDVFFVHLARVSDFCASISSTLSQQPHLIVSEGLNLDTALVNWAMGLDAKWTYTVIPTPTSFDRTSPDRPVYGDTYHLYPNSIATILWDNYVFVRLVIHTVVYGFSSRLAKSSPAHTGQQTDYATLTQQSMQVQKQLAGEICASVPLQLASGDEFCGAMALRLIWPLFLAGDAAGVDVDMKDWIIRCLERIASTMGIQQAKVMVKILRRGGDHLHWSEDRQSTWST